MEQCANSILMVRPASFGFNSQTAESNTFQDSSIVLKGNSQQSALREFDLAVELLRRASIEVLILQDTISPAKPDAIFPNNWFYCHHDGRFFLFPMEAPNRRAERRMEFIESLSEQFKITEVIHLEEYENATIFLEGTGSMVIDHNQKNIYAALFSRTNKMLVELFAKQLGYSALTFNSKDAGGTEIYHTNVLMSIGEKIAIVCSESICDVLQRKKVLETLQASGKKVIELSFDQMNRFAGNVLEIKNKHGKHYLVMSASAHAAFTEKQIRQISEYTTPLPVDIKFIETCGGGSMRCMMAEIFLPVLNS